MKDSVKLIVIEQIDGNEKFIYLGFTPFSIMIKRFSDNTVGQWTIYDTANSPTNEVTKKLLS